MIRRFGQKTSISTVKPASSPLRSQVRPGHRNTFFATCWLIVDPPRIRSVSASAYIARRGAAIEKGAATLREDGRAACFL